jgi:hypothetical protein
MCTLAPHHTIQPNSPTPLPPGQAYTAALAAALVPGSPGLQVPPSFSGDIQWDAPRAQPGSDSAAATSDAAAGGHKGAAATRLPRAGTAIPSSPGLLVAASAACYGAPATPFTAVAAALGRTARLAVGANGGGVGEAAGGGDSRDADHGPKPPRGSSVDAGGAVQRHIAPIGRARLGAKDGEAAAGSSIANKSGGRGTAAAAGAGAAEASLPGVLRKELSDDVLCGGSAGRDTRTRGPARQG